MFLQVLIQNSRLKLYAAFLQAPLKRNEVVFKLDKKGVSDLILGVGIENSEDADVYSVFEAAQ